MTVTLSSQVIQNRSLLRPEFLVADQTAITEFHEPSQSLFERGGFRFQRHDRAGIVLRVAGNACSTLTFPVRTSDDDAQAIGALTASSKVTKSAIAITPHISKAPIIARRLDCGVQQLSRSVRIWSPPCAVRRVPASYDATFATTEAR